MRVFNRTISSIVDENFVYAKALHFLGIEFYEHPNRKLGEICAERGLDKTRVIQSFYLFDRNNRFSFRELDKYPLEIVIEYLRHTHHLFIKEKLPYIAQLLNKYEVESDLKLIFPEFVDEFIAHIYEEEDIIFSYIHRLIEAEKYPSLLMIKSFMDDSIISLETHHHHHQDEDEMAGIRTLIDERDDPSLLWHVVTKEIKAFDRELWYHAEIENKILFPKALELETRVKENIQRLSRLN